MKKIYFLLVVLLVGNFAYGQTLIIGQDFETDTEWTFTADPAAYSESDDKDIWAAVTTVGSTNNGLDAAPSGTMFWGMRDLDNPYIETSPDSLPAGLGLTNPYDHTLAFENVSITGKTDVEVSFYYNAYSLGDAGYIKVEFFFDDVSQGEEIVFTNANGTATDGWEKFVKEIPDGAATNLKMTIHAYNDQDYLALDNIKLEADVPAACPITLGATTADCDANTADVDTYTATLAYSGAGGETYTVTATSGTVGGDDPSTVAAGTITVSGVTEGEDVTITVAGGICNENSVISAPTCEPLVVLQELPIYEPFDYEVGTNLSAHGDWEDLFSGDTIQISEGNLEYDGLPASVGNAVTFSENGLDANLPFVGVTEGAVYTSMLVKVSDLSTLTKGGYFVVLGNDYLARLWLNPDGDQYNVGVSTGSKLNVIDTVKYSIDDVLFIVMNYDFADSTCNVWVNPSVDEFEAASAPAPTITEGSGAMVEIGRIMLRQDSNTETPLMTIDEVRIGTTWASVTPKDSPAVTNGNDWNFSDEQFVALEGEITETTTVAGLTFYASADKNITIGTSASTIGDMEYTHRLKLNGSGTLDESNAPVGRVLSFDVTGNTIISIALTSANSSSDRMLNVAAGSPENVIGQIQATGGVKDVQELTYTGEATTIYIYSDDSGINLYRILATPVAPEVQDWNFSDEQFVALEGEITETTTVAGLTIYASADKNVTIGTSASTIGDMEYTHRMKLNGSGTLDESNVPVGRVLSFDVTGNTLISVALTSANSSSDRMLNIAAGTPDNVIGQVQATGGVKDVQEFTYTGEATTIYIYSDNSGINLYQITAEVATAAVEISNSFDVNVYPNPASNRVFVDVNQPTRVAIYNVAGSLLKLQMVQNRNESIDISELKHGMYIIRSFDSNLFAKKLIVR